MWCASVVNAISGALLASCAIRPCFVDTGSGFDVPVMFPSGGVMSMAFPSLPGVRSGWFPRFVGTTKRSDSPSPVSPSFVAFARRYRRCVRSSSPTAPDARPRIIPELGQPVLPPRHGRRRGWGLPSSRGTLVVVRPVLRPRPDRAVPWGPGVGQPDAAPAFDKSEGSARGDFGAQWHGVRPRCLRFAVVVACPHARLASGGWPSSTGRD